MPELTLVDTDCQTAGRGQQGNSWESEAGCNLSFSLVCHPNFLAASAQFVLSQAIALAVRDALAEEARGGDGAAFTVKWPNDIYYGDCKISGTLIECDLQGKGIMNCIIGTGVNVNQTRFRSDAPNPVSLSQITGRVHDREALLCAIVQRFNELYQRIRQGEAEEVRRLYAERLYRREGLYRYADAKGEFSARIAAVEPTGHLVLQLENNETRRYEFKEIRFLNYRF